ncbi:MAG: HPr(Ser) kinase/phosphatase [Oscillospiraceae bacterium]|jgi:HPr kinase/phosphorylase|nr:HPr(Ser) kinase/phosphatase [Oscillospiraceae bacterium]
MEKNFLELGHIVKYLELKTVWSDGDSGKVKIISRHINRLGLDFIGSISEFDASRIMIFGESERVFLDKLESSEVLKSVTIVFKLKFPALFVTRGIELREEVIVVAKKYSIPVFVSDLSTVDFVSKLSGFLDKYLAPRVTLSAGFISVHGEGVLIIGESGIGKSEVELELIKRGHKFISDDITEIRVLSFDSLLGFAPSNISKFIEVRGIGIINVQQLFGIDAIQRYERIGIAVSLEEWDNEKEYSRLGDQDKYIEILGIKIPYMVIPVKPGKNLAVIIEVAAMNNKLRSFKIDPYNDLMNQLGMADKFVRREPVKVKNNFLELTQP